MLHHLLWATQLMTRRLTPKKFTPILRIVATVFGKDVVLPCAVAVCWRHASDREENFLNEPCQHLSGHFIVLNYYNSWEICLFSYSFILY
ncbi:hypothetical protein MA16_Dca001398 [Dendrobium catenatum]|uniref:Uncharacterized protein n=1 Tax=Dendrobium catenatum TaxID=906689 RepID=A0A2I0WMA5_9ASPA|nr:hypothetical protein MA16_Dca001398 [Dendrobium catenatum]